MTGAPEPSGDFLINAQGEDVVSGVRNTLDIAELDRVLPEVHEQLMEILRELERHYGDMQDTEFTVEEGQLYMLQTRSAKRPAQAAVRFAVDAVDEGLLDKAQALQTIDPETPRRAAAPDLRPAGRLRRAGLAAWPPRRAPPKGEIVFTAADAVAAAADGRDVILARPFTEADDVAGFHAAKGILTSEGGKASHAALVARGMGVPAVTGASALEIDVSAGEVRVDSTTLHAGDRLAIDGTTGSITTDDVPLVEPEVGDAFDTVLRWADELRTLRVRANADTPEDARKAREFGAEGIGLCRTEHMFFGEERHEKMVQVILADDDRGAPRRASTSWRPCSRATSRGCSRRWRACRSPSACSIRRCTSSCPIPTSCPKARSRTVPGRCRRSTRCSARAACASGSSIRRSTRCRSAR